MRQIEPINNNGSIQLKFSYAGKRYSFNPIPKGGYNDKRDIVTARAIATQIQNDILAKNFDPTLDRYRLTPKPQLSQPNNPSLKPKTLLEIWGCWVTSLNLPVATREHHYKAIRQQIAKANPDLMDTTWLTQSNLAASTFNQRLGYLKACFKWAITKGLADNNPYDGLKTRKVSPKSVKPFTVKEITAIIRGFEELAPHYTPFVKFLLATGVRTSEAIGLRWGHLDFDQGLIIIQESLSRDWAGNGYQRVRKETKVGGDRQLKMTRELHELLWSLRLIKHDPESLVFTTVKGKIIDDGNFRERYWLKVLTKVNVVYRNPYTTRHTTASHAIEQHIPITGVAYLLGHKDTRMVMQTYGHMINRPELPNIPIG
ncbi:site-specific integrase [Nostoc sp. 'Peltigera membranacea cyanobiont' 210A]|uniref:site-specific integrase n=1 Tax=Nostoc sp. 'Peltigera membranacea cyanobiont' 210A TaxID=2014529 RepID=UPI000B95C24B|nr:site-specific integrase [Nostoc sp. 'Peltigera membranacea cyanobiont' 210A]OYD96856.1 site-specific integrase [Nostoc sp. 'Peltigera membranacea cyanobiont' 210A]